MNYFNLMREMVEEGFYVTVFSSESEWTCHIHKKLTQVSHLVRRQSPEEAIRCAYLELNPIPRSGAI